MAGTIYIVCLYRQLYTALLGTHIENFFSNVGKGKPPKQKSKHKNETKTKQKTKQNHIV